MQPTRECTPDTVLSAIKQIVVRESRLSVNPASISAGEQLNGRLLRVTSLGLVGMLIRLEDDLGVTLPDDMFLGRKLETVRDLADVVWSACADPQERS